MPKTRIRSVLANEGERLREITAAAKGHWGYGTELVRGWAESLDFSDERMLGTELYVAEIDGRIVGWAEILAPRDGVAVLDHLWIEPDWMSKGVGSELFLFAADRARDLGAQTLEWGAEPNAVGFYEKMGGRYLRDRISEWGRVVPVMGLDL